MLDPTLIQQAKDCDLLALVERYTPLKRVASTGGGEYAGPCPLCPGGRDRFHVQPARRRWMCRYCTNGKWQDAIEFQMRLAGLSFPEAVRALAGEGMPSRWAPPVSLIHWHPGPPGMEWQSRARSAIADAIVALWSPCGGPAREWLHARGFEDETLRRWRVGYIPEERHEAARRWGFPRSRAIYLPRGVLIPGEVDGNVWYLKVRRLAGRPKYMQVRGSRPTLYLGDTVDGVKLACVTEGELDALLLWQCLQYAADPRLRAMGVVTLGSQSARLDTDRWGHRLQELDHLLIFYDQDGKSESGVRYWTEFSERAVVVHWPNLRPGDKDLTDYHGAGGDLVELVGKTMDSWLRC